MIKTTIPACFFIFLFILGCTKKEVKQLDFKGDLKITASTISEMGASVNDKENVQIIVEGSDPKITAFTDASGNCLIKTLPLGTYNLIISKEGYGTVKVQSFRFIGTNVPYTYPISIKHKSTTKIKSYNLSISGTILTLSGNISHNWPKSSLISAPSDWPALAVCISNIPEVSSLNYLSVKSFNSSKNNDTTFTTNVNLDASLFPKGSIAYTVIYGLDKGYFPELGYGGSNTYYDLTWGDPSEVQSIVIP